MSVTNIKRKRSYKP